MSKYYNNITGGATAYSGFVYTNKLIDDTKPRNVFGTDVHKYRFVKPTNADIVSYIVLSEHPTHSWDDFDTSIRWMFALDKSGALWYNVHGKGELATYEQWQLYPMPHDYFNKRIECGCIVFYSNGMEHYSYITARRGFNDSTPNADVLRALVDYKVNVTREVPCQSECTTGAATATNEPYRCHIDLFKRGTIDDLGVEGWVNIAKSASLTVEFDLTGPDVNKVNPVDVSCLAYTRDARIDEIMTITRVDGGYKYSLRVQPNICGFWFFSKSTRARLNVDMTNLRISN
ncbi:hypothetical protein F-LCD7_0029 [Faustovirus]|nr:hypothetical protein F-LCD7_0029 [Faustovirus]